MKKIGIVLCICLSLPIFAQQYFGGNIDVIIDGTAIYNPWVGGFDLPQFSASDINSDGKKDIIVFDKQSSKWLIFLNEGVAGFSYAPQYEILYPEIINMGLIRDYNCDGKGDVIAHANGGIQVFRNTNEDGNPSFKQVKSILEYQIGVGSNNIYKFNNDIIAAEDFDGDGDLDILSFDLLGTTIPYYRNLSVENGFGCDSLIFEENTVCWGNFRESNSDNTVELNFSCKGTSGAPITIPQNSNRHSGSTLAVIDDDEDNDKDLLLGDVSFNNLLYLKNGGTNFVANMVSVEENFPSYNTPINIPLFPAAFYLDVDNDNKRDLLIAPNSSGAAVNRDCVWYYKNTGNSSNRFQLQQKNFLVETQIDFGSYSYVSFFDHNADGLLDMLVANGYEYTEQENSIGKIAYFENTGTSTSPEFTFVTENYQNLNNFNFQYMRPTFGDIDADGDDDMIVGEINGGLHLFLNDAGAGNPANFVFSQVNYFNIDIGTHSHPQLVDLNEDGLLDLVVGRNAPLGNVAYFKNIGTATNAIFHIDTVNEVLGNIHVENPGFLFGYSAPFVAPKDANDKRFIYVGSGLGFVHQYEINMDSLDSGTFVETKAAILEQKAGTRTTIQIIDINNDGENEYFFGNARGGASFYSDAIMDSTLVLSTKELRSEPCSFSMHPNPADSYTLLRFQNKNTMPYNLQIIDYFGKVHYATQSNQDNMILDLSQLSRGTYFVRVQSNCEAFTKKIIKY